jgi:uncharacterized protein YjbJ (UPF0337 family)
MEGTARATGRFLFVMPRSWRSAALRTDKGASRPEGIERHSRLFLGLAAFSWSRSSICESAEGGEEPAKLQLRLDSSNASRRIEQMDKNRIEGNLDKAKGSIKDTVGKAVGNDRLRAEGEADKIKGDIKDAAGKTADAARRGVDKASDAFSNASKH